MMSLFVWLGTTSTAFATAANWLKDDGTAAVPTSGAHTLLFDGRATNGVAGSDQSGVAVDRIIVTSGFTKTIGTYSSGSVTHLKIVATDSLIGEPDADGNTGSGSAGLAFDWAATANTTRILSTPTVGTSGYPPVILRGTATNNKLIVMGGWVGYGMPIGVSGTSFAASTISAVSVLGDGAFADLGQGCTLTTIHQQAGRVQWRSALTSLNQEGGFAKSEGAGAITTADIGGYFVSNSTGTITTPNVQNGGTLDLSQNNAARTLTTTTVFGTGIMIFPIPYTAITLTNGIDLLRGAKVSQLQGLVDVNVALAAP